METHLAYCSALDREVRVFVRPVCYDETDPDVTEPPGIVCIEHAEDCLGIHCPLFQRGTAGMTDRFQRLFRR